MLHNCISVLVTYKNLKKKINILQSLGGRPQERKREVVSDLLTFLSVGTLETSETRINQQEIPLLL